MHRSPVSAWIVDVGRYGFVMLKYYMPMHGFEEDETYTDSRAIV